jgi:hypothetical protein
LPTTPTLYVINTFTGSETELPASAGGTFGIPDVNASARGEILEVLDDADNTTVGPALRIQITSGGAVPEWRHVFAWLPDFVPDAFTGRAISFPEVRFIYYRPRLILHVVEKPGPVYELRLWEKAAWRERAMAPRKPVETGPVRLTLLEVLPAAHVETRYEPAGEPTGLEAVLLDVSTPPGPSRRFWMSTAADDRTTRLDGRLTLLYLASPDVREYRSELTIDDNTGLHESCALTVNHPLRRRGWEIFQEGYSTEGTRTASQLAVLRDPGLIPAYVGLAMLAAGVFFACFIKPVMAGREERT